MIVTGGNGKRKQVNQLDQHGNLYIVDCWNDRIVKFLIIEVCL